MCGTTQNLLPGEYCYHLHDCRSLDVIYCLVKRRITRANDARTCYMHHRANWRTFLILLFVCVAGGWSVAAMGRSESDSRLVIEGAVGDGGNTDDDRWSLDRALVAGLSPMDEFDDALSKDLLREKKHGKERRGPKIWDQWGKWSQCSVTCGVGKIVRWRHCVGGGCAPGEKEAQIKSCTLPAC